MKIGIVPMSAKPYHRGHHYLVTTAANENDKVLLFVSTSDRIKKDQTPIYGEDMESIWKNYLEPIMPSNVVIEYGGSPVRKVFQALETPESVVASGNMIEDTFTIYSDKEDTEQNYTVGRINRKTQSPPSTSPAQKYFPSLLNNGYVKFAAEINPEMFMRGQGAPDISGTEMRRKLGAEELENFKADLPDLDDDSKLQIYDKLRGRIQKEGQLYEATYTSNSVDEAIKRSFINSIVKGS